MEFVPRALMYAFPEVQSCANPGGNKLGILCNAGLISHLKEAWKGKILHLEDMQNQIAASLFSNPYATSKTLKDALKSERIV
ncbi:hypothetical protein, conserved [Eimeria necatrix]|uniref:Uncharacterized protein n=1 Tax=Eimeria necatrix TaxID=51315 RepID=U6MGD1_9EIME|nr:hypothetical protein, conserved [Eimeria necatrix]CDJ63071.1 hypothetical protein, conserved [Eimeria necatrix]